MSWHESQLTQQHNEQARCVCVQWAPHTNLVQLEGHLELAHNVSAAPAGRLVNQQHSIGQNLAGKTAGKHAQTRVCQRLSSEAVRQACEQRIWRNARRREKGGSLAHVACPAMCSCMLPTSHVYDLPDQLSHAHTNAVDRFICCCQCVNKEPGSVEWPTQQAAERCHCQASSKLDYPFSTSTYAHHLRWLNLEAESLGA